MQRHLNRFHHVKIATTLTACCRAPILRVRKTVGPPDVLEAASDLRTELLEELGKLSQTQEANREAARQATDRVAADAAQHAQGCANTVRTLAVAYWG